jgi:cytochrome c2
MRPRIYLALAILLFVLACFYAMLMGFHQSEPLTALRPLNGQPENKGMDSAASTAPVLKRENTAADESLLVKTNLLNLNLRWLNEDQPVRGQGGGMTVNSRGVLIAKESLGAVWFYSFELQRLYQLKFFLPLNNADVFPQTNEAGKPIRSLHYSRVLVVDRDGKDVALAFYGYYDVARNCRTVRVSEASLPSDWFVPPTSADQGYELSWQHLFTAEPCLSFTGPDDRVTSYQDGGAMLQIDQDVYFTTGDMGKDGLQLRKPISTQSDDSDFGRVYKLNLETMKIDRVASGLRNPQGLARDQQGLIWATDHGPMGGDELNLIKPGKNYGWPYATFGADYTDLNSDQRSWPYQPVLGKHAAYDPPNYMWTPSIAPSGISEVDGFHPNWEGNLLVSSLRLGALLRLTLDGDRILGQETIRFGTRLRDVVNVGETVYVLTDNGEFGLLEPRATDIAESTVVTNAQSTLQRFGCLECHANPEMPSLSRVYGAQIGAQAGISYSTGLRQLKGRWTSQNLEAYLLNPDEFAPGTLMPATGLGMSDIAEIVSAMEVLASEDATDI